MGIETEFGVTCTFHGHRRLSPAWTSPRAAARSRSYSANLGDHSGLERWVVRASVLFGGSVLQVREQFAADAGAPLLRQVCQQRVNLA